ncbi:MAG: DJ-1/PfpI family protein [Acidimicrobiia bacterium]|nr:DJ-1/PfpI family protein [Acidimicrobiia bacterium]
MKHLRNTPLLVLAVASLLATTLAGCSDSPGAHRVLVIPRVDSVDMDYMLENEVGVMLEMLDAAGVEADVALPSGQALEGRTMTLEADLSLDDVVVGDYDGVLLPCMAAGYERNEQTVEIVRTAGDMGLPVAAQYGSVYTLAEAGTLHNRQYALGAPIPDWIVEDEGGGIYAGTGVIEDGGVITSGTCSYMARDTGRPDGTPELTRMLIEALE